MMVGNVRGGGQVLNDGVEGVGEGKGSLIGILKIWGRNTLL